MSRALSVPAFITYCTPPPPTVNYNVVGMQLRLPCVVLKIMIWIALLVTYLTRDVEGCCKHPDFISPNSYICIALLSFYSHTLRRVCE